MLQKTSASSRMLSKQHVPQRRHHHQRLLRLLTPPFAEQLFPQLPYPRTERSSCIELHLCSERTLAERQADLHSRLCAGLEDVAQQRRDCQRWLKIRAKAGLSPRSEHLARARCIDADDPPLTPSQIELIDVATGKVEVEGEDKDKDDGFFSSPPK